MPSSCQVLQLFALATLIPFVTAISKPKFQVWYPEFRQVFNRTLHEQCQEDYTYYLTHHGTPGAPWSAIDPAVSCILDHLRGTVTANMQAASVLLGILPSALALAGSSTADTGMLALRRPLLAFLIGASSPAVNPWHTFECKSTSELLLIRRGARRIPTNIRPWQSLVSALEYTLAIGCVLNVALVSIDLGRRTIITMEPESSFIPALWVFLSIPIHLFGAMAVRLRVRITTNEPLGKEDTGGNDAGFLKMVLHYLNQERSLTAFQEPANIVLQHETDLFLILTWLASTATVVHIVAGTIVLSDTLFIGGDDARGVALKLLLSTTICRFILAFEVCGMRQVLEPDDGMESKLGE